MLKVLTKLKTKKKGFTLIELMSVIAIILILSAVLIPKADSQRKSAKDLSASVTNLNRVDGAMMSYFSQSTKWVTNDSKPSNIIQANLDYDKTVQNMITTGGVDIVCIPQVTNGELAPTIALPADLSAYTGKAQTFENTAISKALVTNCLGTTGGSAPSAISGLTDLVPGTIVIDSYRNGMVVYGIDHNGNIVNPRMVQ